MSGICIVHWILLVVLANLLTIRRSDALYIIQQFQFYVCTPTVHIKSNSINVQYFCIKHYPFQKENDPFSHFPCNGIS